MPINLNAGTLYPTPRPILDAVARVRRQLADQPSDFQWRTGPAHLARSRAALARYLNTDPANLLLLPNVTFALNAAINSLDLPAGSEVLSTDHEYGAISMLLKRVARQRGWTIRTATLPYRTEDPAELISAITQSFTDQTRALMLSHTLCTTGLILPLAPIVAAARQRGIVSVIDGAHAPGMTPVDLRAIGADFYAANGHKWIMAPPGSAFLDVAPAWRERLAPVVVSWGIDAAADQLDQPHEFAGGSHWHFKHEFHGTGDRSPQMVFEEVLEYRNTLGGERAIIARLHERVARARAIIGEHLDPATPQHPALHGAMIAFHMPQGDPDAWRNWIWQTHQIECPLTRSDTQVFLRISCRVDTTDAELQSLAEVIRNHR